MIETRFEEETWTPQLLKGTSKMIATTTTSLSRAEMVAAIKLRDPAFVDSTDNYSDAYIAGRYSGSIAMMPVVGVKTIDPAPVAKLDASELSPVTRAMIAAEIERDRARARVTSAPMKKLDAADTEGLSDVTKAMIAAHDRDERQRRGGSNGGGDAA